MPSSFQEVIEGVIELKTNELRNLKSDIYIWGTGEYGFIFSCYCALHDISVKGYLVSKHNKNMSFFLGKPVFSIQEIKDFDCMIVVAVSEKHHREIKTVCPLENICFLSECDMEDVLKSLDCIPRKKWSELVFLNPQEKNLLMGLFEKGTSQALSKLFHVLDNSNGQEFYDLLQEFASYTRYKECYLKTKKQVWHLPDVRSFLYQYKEIFLDRIYEFYPRRERDIFIIDMGINVGTSVKFFHDTYPYAKIEGFEADPKIFQYCKENLKDILVEERVDIHNLAVWDSDGTVEFFDEGADGGRITVDKTMSHVVTVPTIDAKKILLKYEQIDFLKMDIEGAETRVLRRITNELTKVDNIFVEFHSMVGVEQSIDELFSILRHAGFRLYVDSPSLSRQPFMAHPNSNGFDVQMNIFGIRET